MKPFATNAELALDTFTRLPKNFHPKQALMRSLAGGLAGAGIASIVQLMRDKKKRNWRSPLWWGLGGSALGLGAHIAIQNARENLAVDYAQKIDDPLRQVFPKIDPNNPNKTYTISVSGMDQSQRLLSDREEFYDKDDAAVTIPSGYAKLLPQWAAMLPEGAKLNIIGHSAGAAAALEHVNNIKRPVNNFIAVDPIVSMLFDDKKLTPGSHIKNYKVLGAYDLSDRNSVGNLRITPYIPFIRQAVHSVASKYRMYNEHSHSMLTSRFRLSNQGLKQVVADLHKVDKDPDNFYSYFKERVM